MTKVAAFVFGTVSGLHFYAFFAKKTTGDGLGWCIDSGELSHCDKQCCFSFLQCIVQYYLILFVFISSLILMLLVATINCAFENIIVRSPPFRPRK